MKRQYQKIHSPALGRDMEHLVFGHDGYPVIAFPTGGGRFFDFEDNGMIDAISHLIEGGKVKIYCADAVDSESWLNHGAEPQWRAVRHQAYEDYILKDFVPLIRADVNKPDAQIALVGASFGAYHAANFALKFPTVFHFALCLSGRYDLETIVGGGRNLDDVYYNNPMAYVANLNGDALELVRRNTHLSLVCGQGLHEEKALSETHRLANLLDEKHISNGRHIWGHDVEHHWHWWRRQLTHHLSSLFEH